jgi:DNA-binding winged helix-turn-helix (wHTH) protein/WD40 repeat protein
MATNADSAVYEFGEFRLDPAERLLERDGRAVPLTPKAFDLLVYLVERRGRLVEKSTLMSALWPDTTVEEANLAFQVSTLRRVLDEGRNGESFIQTVPTKGYRFNEPVTKRPRADTRIAGATRSAVRDSLYAKFVWGAGLRLLIIAVVLVAAIGAAYRWFASGHERETSFFDPRKLPLNQLTANPLSRSITSARISPDGQYLAYAEPNGIHLKHIDSGGTQRIANTEGMDVYAWSGDGTTVRASACDQENCVGWDVSIVTGSRHRSGASWPKSERISALPDGSRVLRLTPAGDVKVDYLNGAPAHVVCRVPEPYLVGVTVQWSGDGDHVHVIGARRENIQSVPLRGGSPLTVFVASNGPRDKEGMDVTNMAALRDGRLLVVLARAGPEGALASPQRALWEVHTDSRGVAQGARRQLTPWGKEWIEQLSVSADGRRIAFLGFTSQTDIYMADFDPRIGLTSSPKRLTLDERDDTSAAWIPDGKAIVFSSTRNGIDADLFTQRLDSDTAEPLVVGSGDQEAPCVTSDGQWVLYRDFAVDTGYRLMRVPLRGGLSVPLLPMGEGECQCSLTDGCVLWDHHPGEDSFFLVDHQRGKSRELFRRPATTGGALSPDGSQWAYLVPDGNKNRIWFMSLDGRQIGELVVREAIRLDSLCWLDGGGFLTQDMSSRSPGLLYVTPDGRARLLWSQEGIRVNSASVSPDGKHVAINAHVRPRNVCLVQP